MNAQRLSRRKLNSEVAMYSGVHSPDSDKLEFSFQWSKGRLENESFEQLKRHLFAHGIHIVILVDGKDLLD